jgi:synovial sarcoma, X breakpoint 2 interacting protein
VRSPRNTAAQFRMPALDDDSLLSMLDSLSGSTGSDGDSPLRPLTLPSVHASAPTYRKDDLSAAISLANSQIAITGMPARIPTLASNKPEGAQNSLASAVSIIVTLVRSWEANTSLRSDAERALQNIKDERDRAHQTSRKLEQQLESRDSSLRTLQRNLEDAESRDRAAKKRASDEMASLRSRLAALSRREAALVIETKKKDKEYAKLQERVHSMLASRGAIVAPQVSLTPLYRAPMILMHNDSSDKTTEDGEYERFVESAYEERQVVLLYENEEYRGLLQAVQEELEDLVHLTEDNGTSRTDEASSERTDVGEAEILAESICQEQLALPHDAVREEIEQLLDHNFRILRSRLNI